MHTTLNKIITYQSRNKMQDDFKLNMYVRQNYAENKTLYWDPYSGSLVDDTLHINIEQTSTKQNTVNFFLMNIINLEYVLETLKKWPEFYRHVIIYNVNDEKIIHNFLIQLARKCKASGNLWEMFIEYAEDADEDCYWLLKLPVGEMIQGCQPTLSWQLERVVEIPPTQTMYDERIIIDISWLDKEGEEQAFRGYWYATSIASIEQKVQKKGLYYRRCTEISPSFNPENITARLGHITKYLAGLELDRRFFYLQQHFEFDGQSMFYER